MRFPCHEARSARRTKPAPKTYETMKRAITWAVVAAVAASCFGCKAFRTLGEQRINAQGAPYELIVVCDQPEWQGALGDTLRSILTEPVAGLNQREPHFDVLRVLPGGFENLVTRHRNVLQVLVDAEVEEPVAAVQYDLYAQPQIVMTLQGPTQQSLVDYLSAHRDELLYVLEKAERDRTIGFGRKFPDKFLAGLVKEQFGVDFAVPQGYKLRAKGDDFLWISYEFPQASQGFFIYSYPYTGRQALTAEALTAARNRFASRIPGPSEGSYMTTAEVYEPDLRTFRLEGRLWIELRGFWDVKNDFMGGPFVSYTTVDTTTDRVFTVDCYVYSPKNHKRNYLRELEHLLYLISMPERAAAPAGE